MSDPYEKRGYGLQAQGFGQRPAVLVVDFQRGFTAAEVPMGGTLMVDAAVENTGFRVQVPKDCFGDHDAVAHEQNLADVGRRYADIIDASAAVAAIERWRGGNELAP